MGAEPSLRQTWHSRLQSSRLLGGRPLCRNAGRGIHTTVVGAERPSAEPHRNARGAPHLSLGVSPCSCDGRRQVLGKSLQAPPCLLPGVLCSVAAIPCSCLHLLLCGSAFSCPPQGLLSQPQAPEGFSILAHQLLGPAGRDPSWKAEIPVPLSPCLCTGLVGYTARPARLTQPSHLLPHRAPGTCPKRRGYQAKQTWLSPS